MSATIEIVRFEVQPERHVELVAGHTRARRAIRALSPPGSLWSRLTRIGEAGWIEIVAWERREVFDRALELSSGDPVAGAWFDLAEPGWTILLGETEDEPQPPPREGELELVWWRSTAAGPSKPRPGGWSLRVEVDSRAWSDPSGWAEGEPMVLDATAVSGDAPAAEAGGQEPTREGVEIAHAVDLAEEAAD